MQRARFICLADVVHASEVVRLQIDHAEPGFVKTLMRTVTWKIDTVDKHPTHLVMNRIPCAGAAK